MRTDPFREFDRLTVKAERQAVGQPDVKTLVAERPFGTFTRQLFLGDTLDADHIEAHYTDGVLALTIPVHEPAKPRKVEITSGERQKELAAVAMVLRPSSSAAAPGTPGAPVPSLTTTPYTPYFTKPAAPVL